MLTSDLEKAESITDYFANIRKELENNFDSNEATPEHYYRVTPSTNSISITEEQEIRKLESILQKVGGMDRINAQEFAAAEVKLFEGFYGIYSRSINENTFPDHWKTEQVNALKRGTSSERANYRPLTVLNLNSKVLENLIYYSIDSHTADTGLIYPNQWAFQKGISIRNHYFSFSLRPGKKEFMMVSKLEFYSLTSRKKACDTIIHDVLKANLHAAGISGAFLDWLSSYLSNRRQFFVIDGMKSSTQPVEVGVPQGSLLGPRLFTLYVNDLQATETAGLFHMFADDTTIYYIGIDVETIVDALNSILVMFYNWCQQNKLTVHAGRTEAMLISGTPFIGPMREIEFGESTIQLKEQSKCLNV